VDAGFSCAILEVAVFRVGIFSTVDGDARAEGAATLALTDEFVFRIRLGNDLAA
jgi:hypothetical protein